MAMMGTSLECPTRADFYPNASATKWILHMKKWTLSISTQFKNKFVSLNILRNMWQDNNVDY